MSYYVTPAHRHQIAKIGAILLLTSCRDSVGPGAANPPQLISSHTNQGIAFSGPATSRALPDEYIVVFDETVRDVVGRSAVLTSITGAKMKNQYAHVLRGFSAHMTARAAAALELHPGVAYVEQDQEMSVAEVPASWGLDRIDQSALPLNDSYTSSTTGAGVHVYIIDSGIRTTHAQFGGRASRDFSAIADGYGATGCHWHGTHVAGTVGGSAVGVAKAVQLHSVRVLDCMGLGSTSNIIAGMDWVAANRVRPAVANISIVGSASAALNEAVDRLTQSGVVVAVAAGNAASDACAYSPASAPGALTVGATTNGDAMASYSNWGGCVDLLAPGSGINSAMSFDDINLGLSNGTSMASPHVAGAAALYLQANPSASPAQVASAIVGDATRGAVTGAVSATPNFLLRVNGAGGTVTPPSPPLPPANYSPIASFTASCERSMCSFDGSGSSDDAGIVSYSWSFGDGTSSAAAASPYATHRYAQKGIFSVTVSLTVSDALGAEATTSRTIQIKTRGK